MVITVSPIISKFHDTVRLTHGHSAGVDILADRARRQIDLELQRLEDSIRSLRSTRNLLAPVARLPPEVLCKVFSFRVADCAGGNNPLEWVRVSHVSRHWRAVALECPSLWGNLVFSRPKWCDEMLKRSKMAALVVKADLTCLTPRILESVRLALLHGPRVRELRLHGSSAVIERLLTETSFQASTLQSLSLAAPCYTSFGTDGGITIPENTLTSDMPHLRRLELSKCNIKWDSPLLNNLTHLQMHQISTDFRPTTEQFVNALERMPVLEVLDLQGALPSIETPESLPRGHVAKLPRLSQLILKCYVLECLNVVEHISIPSTARVHLGCSGTEAAGSDFSGILKVFSSDTKDGSSGLSLKQGRRMIRVLHIYNESAQTLVIRGWTKHSPEMHSGLGVADIQLNLSWHSSTSPAVDVFLAALCKSVNLLSLRSLRVSYLSGMNTRKWVEMFGTLPKLRSISVTGSSAQCLISALREERCQVLSPLSPRGGSSTSRRPGLRRTKSGMPSVYFAGLKTLTLEDVSFGVPVPLVRPFEELRDCLMERSERKAEIEELRLRECCYMTEEDVELLEELVVSVDWDGVEKGFTDEEEEEEDGYMGYGYNSEGYDMFGPYDSDSELEFATSTFPFY